MPSSSSSSYALEDNWNNHNRCSTNNILLTNHTQNLKNEYNTNMQSVQTPQSNKSENSIEIQNALFKRKNRCLDEEHEIKIKKYKVQNNDHDKY